MLVYEFVCLPLFALFFIGLCHCLINIILLLHMFDQTRRCEFLKIQYNTNHKNKDTHSPRVSVLATERWRGSNVSRHVNIVQHLANKKVTHTWKLLQIVALSLFK